MGDLAKSLALPSEFEFKGAKYTLRPLNFYMLGKYASWLEQGAWGAADRAKRYLDSDSYKSLIRAIGSDIACRLYEPGGPYFLKSESTTQGQVKLLELMTEHNAVNENWSPEVVVDIWLDPEKREEVTGKMEALNTDPKVIRGMMIPETVIAE